MTDRANSSQSWPAAVIEQAIDIIMDRFGLDAARALKVLRRMSQNTRTQMCVVAEQIINHENVLMEAVRDLEEDLPASS
jgi:hypothetical protein